MREMKNSGVAWIGNIPDSWEVKPIRHFLDERIEKNSNQQVKAILSLSAKEGVTLYNGENHSGNKPREDLSDYKIVRKNDIVANSMNILSGSVGLSDYLGVVSPVYYVYYNRDSNVNNLYYLYYLFQCKEFQRGLWGLGNGILVKESESGSLNTIRTRIPSKRLRMQLFPSCSKKEQDQIVIALDKNTKKIDILISNQEQQIEKLKQYKQSLITEVVTKGLNPDVPMKDSGVKWIGQIPEEWNLTSVRYIGSLQNGISKSGEAFGTGYPFVCYGDIYKNYELPTMVAGLVETNEKEREQYSVEYGDVFFTRTSETIEEVGFSCVCKQTISNATFAGFVIRMRPYKADEKILTNFAKYYFRGSQIRAYLVKEMNLVTRASLGQTLLKGMSVTIPPKEEQQKIADFLDDKCAKIDRLIAIKQEKIDKLNDYKKSLIYEYVTGKREVC